MLFEILTITVSIVASLTSIGSIIMLMRQLLKIRKERGEKPKTLEIDIKDSSGKLIEKKIIRSEDAENFLRMLNNVPGNTFISNEAPEL